MRRSSRLILVGIHLLFLIQIDAQEGPSSLQSFIDEAVRQGRGEVIVPPGEHLLPNGLNLKGATHLTLAGMERERTILKLPPLAFAEASASVEAGKTAIPIARQRGLQPGMRLQIAAPGEKDAFSGKNKPTFVIKLKTAHSDRLELDVPLPFPVPKGTLIRNEDAPNLIDIRSAGEDITIRNLTLDGGRTVTDPPVQGHAQLCAIFAAGPYNYEKGPTGPKIKQLTISDCLIQNCFGRGVALYSVDQAVIERCSIRDTLDEAVDLDHFVTKVSVRQNHIARCRVAIELNDANDCLIEANETLDCGTAINLWRWCKMPELNQRNRIVNNAFTKTRGTVVRLASGTARNEVAGNDIDGAGGHGVSVAGDVQIVRSNSVHGVKEPAIEIIEGRHTLDDIPAR